jgi:hypothetical protein
LLFGGTGRRLRELGVGMGRVGLRERKSWASPPEAARLLRVPRRAAVASRPCRAAIPDAGFAGMGARRRNAIAFFVQSAVRRSWGRSVVLISPNQAAVEVFSELWLHYSSLLRWIRLLAGFLDETSLIHCCDLAAAEPPPAKSRLHAADSRSPSASCAGVILARIASWASAPSRSP